MKHLVVIGKGTATITEHKVNILQLVAMDYTRKEISKLIFCSHRTVEAHLYNMRKLFQVKSDAALIAKAIKLGLINLGKIIS